MGWLNLKNQLVQSFYFVNAETWNLSGLPSIVYEFVLKCPELVCVLSRQEHFLPQP